MPEFTEGHHVLALLRVIEDGFNGDRLDALDDVIAQDVVLHVPFIEEQGRDAFKAALRALRVAFPDVSVAIEDIAVAGDVIFRRWTAVGTHTGPLFDLPATGRPIRVTGVDIERFSGAQVVEHWSFWDQTLMTQLTGDGL